jgi:hypothetical protein
MFECESARGGVQYSTPDMTKTVCLKFFTVEAATYPTQPDRTVTITDGTVL